MEDLCSSTTIEGEKTAIVRNTLTPEQEEVLSNPSVLTTFIYLLDGQMTTDELARRTGFRPLETSVYLDRLLESKLVAQTRFIPLGGKSVQMIYHVVDPNLDVSSVVPKLSPMVTLDLLYNKVKKDLGRMNMENNLFSNSEIKFAQIQVRPEAYERFREMMAQMNRFIQDQETPDGEETVSLFLIGYRTKNDSI